MKRSLRYVVYLLICSVISWAVRFPLSRHYYAIEVADVALTCTLAPLSLASQKLTSSDILKFTAMNSSYDIIQVSTAGFRLIPKDLRLQDQNKLAALSVKINSLYSRARIISDQPYCLEKNIGFDSLFTKPTKIASVTRIPSLLSGRPNFIAFVIFLPVVLFLLLILLDLSVTRPSFFSSLLGATRSKPH